MKITKVEIIMPSYSNALDYIKILQLWLKVN